MEETRLYQSNVVGSLKVLDKMLQFGETVPIPVSLPEEDRDLKLLIITNQLVPHKE